MTLGELSAQHLSQARQIAGLLRDGSLGVLVGAGLSRSIGLPGWADLLDRLALARYVAELDLGLVTTGFTTYKESIALAFPTELLRAQALARRAGPQFDLELWRALYLPPAAFTGFDPDTFRNQLHERVEYEPNELIRSIAALPCRLEARPEVTIHTLNFDDLLVRAGNQIYPGHAHAEGSSQPLHRSGLTVAHLHGRMAPGLPAKSEDIVLTSADFHRARATWNWPYRRLFDLFEQRSVLMIGIGLADPNLLQVLDLVPERQHYLVHSQAFYPPGSARGEAWKLKQQHWSGKVEFVNLGDWSDQAAFVNAIRVFAADDETLWPAGYRHVLELTRRDDGSKLWEPQIRGKAARLLRNVAGLAREKLAMSTASRVEAGLFVPIGDGDMLDLPFRSDVGDPVAAGRFRPGYRKVRASITAPQGLVGMAFAQAELIIAEQGAEVFDYGFDATMRGAWSSAGATWRAVAGAPVYDWTGGRGVPVGVGYISSTTADDLSQTRLGPENVRFLDEVILGRAMVGVLESLKRGTS